MLPETLNSSADLPDLINHRNAVSVSIYLASSHIPSETGTAQLTLKNLVAKAADTLKTNAVRTPEIDETLGVLRGLENDTEFWPASDDAVALFVSPGEVHAFTFAGELADRLVVSDRFDVGPLLRATTVTDAAWIVTLSRGDAHLYLLSNGSAREVKIHLPGDLRSALTHAENKGDMDRDRAQGSIGDRGEHEKYAREVSEAVATAIKGTARPMILAAADDLDNAYRSVSSYPHLLDTGITQHPESLSPDDLASHAQKILDDDREATMSQWREDFGSRRANGLATTKLDEVAMAATAAAVDELMFNPARLTSKDC